MNLLELVPVRASEWEESDDRVVLVRPRPRTRGPRAVLDWIAYLLAPRRIRLDALGSFCWRRMDGRRTAGEIAERLRKEFGESAEPAEERLGRFIQLLQREELVSLPELESHGG